MTTTTSPGTESGEKLYTIGTVSKLTGIGAVTLRAWERRYELIHPVRKESGHRLYTRKHIDQINRITALTNQGMRISQIRPAMLETEVSMDDAESGDENLWAGYLDSMIAAIVGFDEERIEEIYNEALSLYPIELVTRKLLKPLLVDLGVRWETAEGSVAEEHFFAFYLRNKLGARFHHQIRNTEGTLLLLAGLPGEYHEIALLLFALAAIEAGYRLVVLGADLPLDELPLVVRKTQCEAVVLSGAIEPARRTLDRDLPRLAGELDVPVFVGGPSSVYACDAINKSGARALGQDIEVGLKRLEDQLGDRAGRARIQHDK